ncbi:hypothetical protein BGZ76_002078 [Entomortierella beljakovae]|nr:hypothetical protein BGZ76_002078 [Entomortierella beljakovae]
MADRVAHLLPAMRSSVPKLRASQSTSEQRNRFNRMEQDLIQQDEEPTLKGILGLLGLVNEFTEYVCADDVPVISDVYPRVRDLIDKTSQMVILDPIVQELRDNLVEEIEERWKLENVSDIMLILAYLNPGVTNSTIFDDIIKKEDMSVVVVREYVRGLLLNNLLDMKRNEHISNGSPGNSLNERYWMRELELELKRYNDDAGDMQCDPAKVCEWWEQRSHCFPYLSPLARIYFSVQASSAASERLFSGVRSLLTEKSDNLTDEKFNRLILMRTMTNFLQKLKDNK